MKHVLTTLHLAFALLLTVPLLFAGATILNFQALPGYNQVVVKWSTQNELDLKGFEVQRSFDGQNYKKIAFVDAKDEIKPRRDYEYADKTVFKSMSRTFYYRLKLVDKDETKTSFTRELMVTPTVSSARQTWGSIKAMFR